MCIVLLTSILKVDGSGLAALTTHLKYTPMSSTSNCVVDLSSRGFWGSGAEEEAASRQLSMSIVRQLLLCRHSGELCFPAMVCAAEDWWVGE